MMTIERDEELRKVAEAAIGKSHDSPYSVDFSRTFRPSVALELLDRAVNAEEAVRRLSAALEKLSRLGNGDRPGNSIGNVMAQAAISDPIVKRIVEGKEMGKFDDPANCPICGQPPTQESHPSCGLMLTCPNGHRSEWGEWHKGVVRLERGPQGTFKYRKGWADAHTTERNGKRAG